MNALVCVIRGPEWVFFYCSFGDRLPLARSSEIVSRRFGSWPFVIFPYLLRKAPFEDLSEVASKRFVLYVVKCGAVSVFLKISH